MKTGASHQSDGKLNACGQLLNDEDCQKYRELTTYFDILHEQFEDLHRQFSEIHNQAMKMREAGELHSKGQVLHRKAKGLHEDALIIHEQGMTVLERVNELRHKGQSELIRKTQDIMEKLQDS
jgi:uncharacterized coiled-coil DUF342 family protein